MMHSKFFLALVFCCIGFDHSAYADSPLFADTQASCVAWKAKARLVFLIAHPIGKSCHGSVHLVQNKLTAHVEMEVPLATLLSEKESRDHEVRKALKEEIHPNLLIRTTEMNSDELKKLLLQSDFKLPIELRIGNDFFPLELKVHRNEKTYEGSVDTALSALKIEGPSVLGGVVASVSDEISLHVQIPIEAIQL